MLNYLVWIIVGAAIGAVFGVMRQMRHQEHDFKNDIFFGVAAAAIGGLVVSPLVGVGTSTETGFGFGAAVVAALATVATLGAVTYARHRAAR